MNVDTLAADIDKRIRALDRPTTDAVRLIRRDVSATLRAEPGDDVLALALVLRDRQRWVAYELVYHHKAALAGLHEKEVEDLGHGIGSFVGQAFGATRAIVHERS